MNRTNDLVYWITERERMRTLKENYCDLTERLLPKRYGYSDDPCMGFVRYCNVRREDDKVTKWLAQNWRPNHHAVWEIVLARMINYIPSLERLTLALPYPDAVVIKRCTDCLKNMRSLGDKIFTSAYTISTCGESMDKIDYVMRVVGECNYFDADFTFASLAGCHESLMRIKGLGSFLAAQIIADLKNTAGHPLQDASDWHTWAAPGPGSLRGLEAYFGRPVRPAGFTVAIGQAWANVKPLLPEDLQDLHMQDFQNCLCEFSKYIRVKEGNGHVRNKYAPR